MLADYHGHSDFSDDSTYPMEQIAADAVALNLDELCFTDHVDYGVKTDWDSGQTMMYRNGAPLANVDYPRYMEEAVRVQDLFHGLIVLKKGVELGVQTHTADQFRQIFHRYSFDCVLLSIHQVEVWSSGHRTFSADDRKKPTTSATIRSSSMSYVCIKTTAV